MNRELEIKLQAYLDGELSEREACLMRDRLSEDPKAVALLRELTWTRSLLCGNEPNLTVPETQDFYWSKISREIQREERALARHRTPWENLLEMIPWRRALAPVSGLTVALFLVFGLLKFYDLGTVDSYPRHLARVENPSDEVGAFSFRSQSENVFVIWLYERSPEIRTDTTMLDDMILQ